MAFFMTSESHIAIPLDLSRSDSYGEIISSLDKLEKLFDEVTTAVACRVQNYQLRLRDIESRVDASATTVRKMEGEGRGFHVLSRPTFPKVYRDNGALFPRRHVSERSPVKAHVQWEESYSGSGTESDVRVAADLLSFLNVPAPSVLDKTQNHMYEELGEMPHSLMYASSILVFHSKANPYLPEVTEAHAEVVMQQQAQLQKLAPQPPTLLYGEEAWRLAHFKPPSQDFKFQPGPAAANGMHLPSTLALPNIAVEGSFPEVVKSEWDMGVVPSVVKAKRSDAQRSQPVDERAYDDSRPLPKLPDISPKPLEARIDSLDLSDFSELPDIHSDPRSLKRELPLHSEDPADRLRGQISLRFSSNLQPLARKDDSMSVWTENSAS
jgi:hypothetical protein